MNKFAFFKELFSFFRLYTTCLLRRTGLPPDGSPAALVQIVHNPATATGGTVRATKTNVVAGPWRQRNHGKEENIGQNFGQNDYFPGGGRKKIAARMPAGYIQTDVSML